MENEDYLFGSQSRRRANINTQQYFDGIAVFQAMAFHFRIVINAMLKEVSHSIVNTLK